MILGFTGTQHGMTQRQRATVCYLLNELRVTELHHGDCIGADAEIHKNASIMPGVSITSHPPLDDKLRAYCIRAIDIEPGYRDVAEPKPYLARNHDIVKAGVDGLIATPKDYTQPKNLRGQGTWTTIGYARKAGRRLWIVFPDGTFKEEVATSHESKAVGYLQK